MNYGFKKVSLLTKFNFSSYFRLHIQQTFFVETNLILGMKSYIGVNKCLLTVMGSSPLFLLAGSKEIFGTGSLWPLIQADAVLFATQPFVSG